MNVSGLNLYILSLCLQKCLTVSHHLEEQGASTKITMKVSSDYCLPFVFLRLRCLDYLISRAHSLFDLVAQRAAESSARVSGVRMKAQGEVDLSMNPVLLLNTLYNQQLAELQHNTSFHSWEAA